MEAGFDILSEVSKSLAAKQVGIEEFCESDAFCGKRLYPRQRLLLKLIFLEELNGHEEDILDFWLAGGRDGKEITISPMIRERIDFLRSTGFRHFREIVMVGGRRSSKGFVTGLALAKLLYDTLQLQDPGTYYGIDPDKEIYFSCVAGSQDQAKKFQYADFSGTVNRCEAMQDYIYKTQELEFSVMTESDKARIGALRGRKIGRDTSKLRGNALAANASTIRGSATMACVFDEMAFMQQEGESAQTAEQVYEAVMPSLAQFGKDALVFLNSSPYTKLGKFYQRYEEGLKVVDGKPAAPYMFTFQFPSWALFEGYQLAPKSRFSKVPIQKAITVSPDWDPMEKLPDGRDLHSAEDKDNILITREEERQDVDKFKVERRGQFQEIIDAYLRPEMVDRAYAGLPQRDGGYLSMKTNWSGASWRYKYKAHLDPSSTTAGFGFALGHVDEIETPDGRTQEHVIIDIVKRWKPTDFVEGVVDWEIVLKDIVQYIHIFRPYEVTFDQFQSAAPIQWLNSWLRSNNLSEIRVYEKTAPQPLDARVLTPAGWTVMGALQVGDSVIGSDGKGKDVNGIYPKGYKSVYKVHFSDGASTECTEDHIWSVRNHKNRDRYSTLTLRQMMDKGLQWPSGPNKWAVPYVQPVNYDLETNLPLEPYLLGTLLGDGCLGPSLNIASNTDDIEEQIKILQPCLPQNTQLVRRGAIGKSVVLSITRTKGKENEALKALRELKLYGVRGREKFIPPRYLTASIENRIRLLQGLIDTDGSVRENSYGVSFSTSGRQLANDVVELVGSLGGSAQVFHWGDDTKSLHVAIRKLPDIVPCRLSRKVGRYHANKRGSNHRFITHVEYVGTKETQCISVESEDHLYVTDDFILTHNTAQYNWNRAEVFRTALYQDLIHIPNDTADAQWSNLELKNLQQVNTSGRFPRIDKQEIGPVQTKDMADAIMEVVEALIGNVINNQTRESLGALHVVSGAQGGYSIGGGGPGGHVPESMKQFYGAKHAGEQSAVASKSTALDNLEKIANSRSGTWSSRQGSAGRRGRSRGY